MLYPIASQKLDGVTHLGDIFFKYILGLYYLNQLTFLTFFLVYASSISIKIKSFSKCGFIENKNSQYFKRFSNK